MSSTGADGEPPILKYLLEVTDAHKAELRRRDINTMRDLFIHVVEDQTERGPSWWTHLRLTNVAREGQMEYVVYKRNVLTFLRESDKNLQGVYLDIAVAISDGVLKVGGTYPDQWLGIPRAEPASMGELSETTRDADAFSPDLSPDLSEESFPSLAQAAQAVQKVHLPSSTASVASSASLASSAASTPMQTPIASPRDDKATPKAAPLVLPVSCCESLATATAEAIATVFVPYNDERLDQAYVFFQKHSPHYEKNVQKAIAFAQEFELNGGVEFACERIVSSAISPSNGGEDTPNAVNGALYILTRMTDINFKRVGREATVAKILRSGVVEFLHALDVSGSTQRDIRAIQLLKNMIIDADSARQAHDSHMAYTIVESAKRDKRRLRAYERQFFRQIEEKLAVSSNAATSRAKSGLQSAPSAPLPNKRKPPESLCCSLTLELFKYPVHTSIGTTYERSEIVAWFKTHDTDPLTGKRLADKSLEIDTSMIAKCRAWLND